MSAPVLWMCMFSSSGRVRTLPTASRSIACPPAIPREPQAAAKSWIMCSCIRGIVGEAVLGEELEGEALQRVAREQRRGLVELDVAGGLAAPQHVVVHARQVVVDERVRMDQLDGGRGDLEPGRIGARHDARGEDEHRPHALAAAERGVAHRVVQPRAARCAKSGSRLGEDGLHSAGHLARPGREIGGAHESAAGRSLQHLALEHADARLRGARASPRSGAAAPPRAGRPRATPRAGACRPPCGPRWPRVPRGPSRRRCLRRERVLGMGRHLNAIGLAASFSRPAFAARQTLSSALDCPQGEAPKSLKNEGTLGKLACSNLVLVRDGAAELKAS